jgi:hypothetical protein
LHNSRHLAGSDPWPVAPGGQAAAADHLSGIQELSHGRGELLAGQCAGRVEICQFAEFDPRSGATAAAAGAGAVPGERRPDPRVSRGSQLLHQRRRRRRGPRRSSPPGHAWRIGIRHPLIADALATVLAIRDGAVATSGAYERGEHIRDPFTAQTPIDIRSVTIVGPSLTSADAYATAAFAMDPTGLAWVAGQPDYEGCAITTDPDADPSAFGRRLVWTTGFERYFADR